jgi:hypothetical protein
MVFPIVAPADSRGPWCEKNLIFIISESFHLSLRSSGPVLLEKISKWFHPIFAFCDYFPFEKYLALYCNNLEFSIPKNDLYQVWLKLAHWFWERFLKISIVFLFFRYYLPLEKGVPLHLNNFQSPSPSMICAKSD